MSSQSNPPPPEYTATSTDEDHPTQAMPQAAPAAAAGQPVYYPNAGQGPIQVAPAYSNQQQPLYYGQPGPSYGVPQSGQPQPQVVYSIPMSDGSVQYVAAGQQPVIIVQQAGPGANNGMPGMYPYQSYSCGSNSCCSSYLNYFLLFALSLAWIACCVVFGSPLHRIERTGASDTDFYWNKVKFNGDSTLYSDTPLTECARGGKGFLTIAVIAFVALSVYVSLMIYRFSRLGGSAMMGGVRPPLTRAECDRLVARELSLNFTVFILFLLGLIVWSSSCVKETKNAAAPDEDVVLSGFGFWIFNFILLIGALAHAVSIKQNPYYSSLGRPLQ